MNDTKLLAGNLRWPTNQPPCTGPAQYLNLSGRTRVEPSMLSAYARRSYHHLPLRHCAHLSWYGPSRDFSCRVFDFSSTIFVFAQLVAH